MTLKLQLQLEEAAGFLATLVAWYVLGQPLWLFAALFLLPDLSMLGYLGGNRLGAFAYNLIHHKGLALALAVAGLLVPAALVGGAWLLPAGILLYGHSCWDRMLGYGLKETRGFNYTHLGVIGKGKIANQ